jgi:hypothetical protein
VWDLERLKVGIDRLWCVVGLGMGCRDAVLALPEAR